MTSVCLGNVPNGMYSDATMTTTTNYNFNCNQIIPWSGGAGDDNNQRLIVWGGGHSDYAGNEVSVLNLKGTPSWQAVTSPTIPVPYVWDGNDWEGLQPYFVRPVDGGQPQPGASPSSRHTYNSVQYVPYQNKLYSFGGAVANGGFLSQETWTLDMGTATWTLLGPPYSLAPGYPTTAYNPNTGHIVMHDKNWSLLDFDPNSGNWSTLTGGYHVEDGTTGAIDPVNNLFVVVGAAGTAGNTGYPSVPTSHTVQVFPLTPPYTMQTWSDPSCDLVYRSAGLAWDSVLGLMVGYPGGGNQVYLLNTGVQDVVTPFGTVSSHKCLDVPISLNPSPVKGTDYPQDPEGTPAGSNLGINGRFAYLPSLDTFVMANDRTKNAWTLQLTGGSSAPSFTASISPGTVAVTEGSQGTSVITTTVSGGFSNAITPSAVGLPQGVTVGFSPSTIAAPGSGSSTMNITVPASTPVGTYPFVVSAVGGGDTVNQTVILVVTSNGPPNFTITATPASLTIAPGNQGTSTITTTISGTFNSAISLSAAGMPSTTTVSFNPNPIPAPGSGSTTMTITVGSGTPTGTYPITVTGNGGGIQQNTTVTLTVGQQQPTFTISASPSSITVPQGNQGASGISTTISGGFNSSISLSASGVPSGTIVTFTPQTIAAPGSGASAMNVAVGSGTPVGTYPITVTGSGGGIQQNTTVMLTVTAGGPSFTISALPASLSIVQGKQGASAITTTISGGFNSAISLSASGMPTGTTVSFSPQTIPAPGAGSSGMTVTVGSSTPAGTYPITLIGTGGGIQRNTTLTLTVVPQQQPSFVISASPASLSVAQGNQGSSTITTAVSGGFNSAITLSASGMPSGTMVSFNPNPIPAPGSGSSTMTITVGSSTPTGTYPITVTGNGGGIQQNATVNLTVTPGVVWQQGFDFRNTASFVTDPAGDNYVLSTTAYPTKASGVTYGWVKTSLVNARDRNAKLDPRLAGINYANNGSPAMFYVDLPSAGAYNLALAMGDAGYAQCWVQCQVQFLDGGTVLATVTGGPTNLGFFYDAKGKNWSAATWPTSNLSQQVTLTGTRLTVVVGLSKGDGYITPIAFLGVAQVSGSPNFGISASPASLSIAQGNQATSTITTTISGGFNNAISLSASGVPSGTTVSFNPNPIAAPGSGSSAMNITVGSSTPTGTYPITVTGSGGGLKQTTTVTLTVTALPNFTISASPASLSIQQGHQGTSTITTSISGGFNNAISLSASGMPSGTTVSFNPNPIPAPGSGSTTMTITVGSNTPTGTYPVTVTGTGGGIQQNATVNLTVTSSGSWQQGFDFRNTAGFVSDPSGDTYVLSTTAYPTKGSGVTYGWVKTSLISARDRNAKLDPRLAGINLANNGAPATFYVDLPSAGTYNLSLALGDAGYQACWVQCLVQFLDGGTVLATLIEGPTNLGYFYDAQGKNWSAAAWPTSNLSQQVTLAGTRLTVVVGTSKSTGDSTPMAFLGVAQVSGGSPNFAISASPASLSVAQGNQGTSTITTTISGGFNGAITLSASGVPSGTTVSFNPNPIPAPGAGSSTMTLTVGASTPVGSYPITVSGNGGGVQQNTTVTLTVTAQQQPNFTLSASPASLSIPQGNQGTSTITTTISGGFNSAITFSTSGAPSGTTVSFNPNPIPAPGSGSSTMTITVGSSTPTGTYPITVTGNGGGIQQNVTVSLTVTSSGGGGGGGNGIVVSSTSGSPQTNRFVSIGRFFKQGDIPHFAQAVVGGTAILTQCDVKNRWPDGSLKFGIISFIVPSVATGGTQVTFQDQGTGNNTGYLVQSDMLNAAYDFDGVIQLTGTRSPSVSARSMLQAGNFTYWLQGPIVTAVILEDRNNRTFDVNTDGGSGNPLHPILEAWFYPQTHQVELGFTLENSWASSTAASSARNQTYALTLTTGFNNPATQLTQSSFTQLIFSRWRRSFWIDSSPAPIQINYNWPYLASTGAYAHFNPNYTPNESDLEAMYAVYTNEPAGRLTIPGIDQLSGNGGIVNYDESINSAGYSPWIGPYSQWDVDYLMTGDNRMQKMMTDNADLSGRFPIFFREADHNPGTGKYFDAPGNGSVDPYGHVVSINARQYATLNLANDWNYSCNNNGADFIATGLPGDGSGWYSTPGDTSHLPDFAYVPYTLTGKYFYLEHEMLEAGFAAGHGVGCYSATASYGRQGHYGMLYSATRELAWALRTMAYAAFVAPDGTPEGPYFASKVINNVAMIEGEHALPQTVSGADPAWAYNWGQNYFQFSQAANPSPLSFWRMGDCQDGTTTCYVANGDGANNNINAAIIQSAESGFMSSFIDIVLGLTNQMGIVDTTSILQRNARRYFNILLNPAVNHYLVEQYVYPTTLVGIVCQNPANPGCVWVSDWGTFQTGYLALPAGWSNSGADYGAEAASALSFMTKFTVDGYSGQDAWNFFTSSDSTQLGLVYNNEPQWSISPIQ
jgi:uncharacterized membrane protein